MKSNESGKPRSNLGQELLTPGEPGAMKVASPVRRGGCGNVPLKAPEYTEWPHGESATTGSEVTRHAPTLPHEASFNLRETSPLLRNILHTCEVKAHEYTEQRTSPKVWLIPTDYQGWLSIDTSPKVSAGYLNYPADVRDTAKSGIGYVDNRHLNDLIESISVNVGGSYWNVKVSMSAEVRKSVGGVIVLRLTVRSFA